MCGADVRRWRCSVPSRSFVTAGRSAAVDSAAYGIMDHDFVVWLGDLNYRIDNSLEDTLKRAKSDEPGDLQFLLNLDQARVP
jgi:hypothetical protein